MMRHNENSYLAGTCISFDFINDEAAKAIGSSEYYEIFIRDWNDFSTPRMIMDGNSESIEGIRTYIASYQEVSEEGNESDEVSIDNQTNSYSQLVGTWEEDSDLTYKARYTFYEDGKVKLEYTESEGADCGENAKFDGVNATWAWTTGDLAGFGGALGPMEGFDGNSFTIPAPNAYEEAKRFIKTN